MISIKTSIGRPEIGITAMQMNINLFRISNSIPNWSKSTIIEHTLGVNVVTIRGELFRPRTEPTNL